MGLGVRVKVEGGDFFFFFFFFTLVTGPRRSLSLKLSEGGNLGHRRVEFGVLASVPPGVMFYGLWFIFWGLEFRVQGVGSRA